MYKDYGKRFFDLFCSLLTLVFLGPILGLIAILVRIKLGSPVLFCPTRPGKDEKIFHLYKFRTMSNAKDKEGILLPEKERVTKFGKFLRSSSLDELPELLNIVKGDMSIVGPRPLPMKYLPYYSERQRMRHSIRPGLTGLAQISGRNNLPWNQRFETDLEYVENLSFANDMLIILKTVFKVFRGADVVVPGETTFYQFDTYKVLEEEKDSHNKTGKMSWREIGSNYWITDNVSNSNKERQGVTEWLPSVTDSTLTFSGRTAIEIAILDILFSQRIKKAGVPSHCSFAMLQPFIKNNIPYEFYDITIENGCIEYKPGKLKDFDVVLVMSYFGTGREQLDKVISQAKQNGCIVIEDITHSLLSKTQGCEKADYYVASLRKWFPAPAGGWLAKLHGRLSVKPNLDGSSAVEKAMSAMQEKSRYMHGETNAKEDFLVEFTSLESDLVQLNCMISLDSFSKQCLETVDIEYVKERRRKNAKALYKAIAECNEIEFLIREEDLNAIVPMYVPILLQDGEQRDKLKQYLAEKGIYCPVTWPETTGAKKGFRQKELSLVCDQRYGENDMDVMADRIREWISLSGT